MHLQTLTCHQGRLPCQGRTAKEVAGMQRGQAGEDV